jgi:hypothetical protein
VPSYRTTPIGSHVYSAVLNQTLVYTDDTPATNEVLRFGGIGSALSREYTAITIESDDPNTNLVVQLGAGGQFEDKRYSDALILVYANKTASVFASAWREGNVDHRQIGWFYSLGVYTSREMLRDFILPGHVKYTDHFKEAAGFGPSGPQTGGVNREVNNGFIQDRFSINTRQGAVSLDLPMPDSYPVFTGITLLASTYTFSSSVAIPAIRSCSDAVNNAGQGVLQFDCEFECPGVGVFQISIEGGVGSSYSRSCPGDQMTTLPFNLPHPRGNGTLSVCVPVPTAYVDQYPDPNCQYVEYVDYGPLDPGSGDGIDIIKHGSSGGGGGLGTLFSFRGLYNFFGDALGGMVNWLKDIVSGLLQFLYYILIAIACYFVVVLMVKFSSATPKSETPTALFVKLGCMLGAVLATIGILFGIKSLTLWAVIIFGVALTVAGAAYTAPRLKAGCEKMRNARDKGTSSETQGLFSSK